MTPKVNCASYTAPQQLVSKAKYEAYYAKVGEIDEPDTEYPVGTNCLVLINDKEEGIESAVFVDTDKDGNISRIKVSTDDRYAFRIHLPEPRKTKLDDIEIETPDSVAYLVLMRAIIIGFVNAGTELERIENDPDRIAHETYAKKMLEGLKKDIQEDAIQAFHNIIGYLFAKAVETELVRDKKDSDIRKQDACDSSLGGRRRVSDRISCAHCS